MLAAIKTEDASKEETERTLKYFITSVGSKVVCWICQESTAVSTKHANCAANLSSWARRKKKKG